MQDSKKISKWAEDVWQAAVAMPTDVDTETHKELLRIYNLLGEAHRELLCLAEDKRESDDG